MKLQLLLSLLGLLAVTTSGIAIQKAVIVSYPNDTPDSVVNQAMDAVREAVSLENSWSKPLNWSDHQYRVALSHMNIVSSILRSSTSDFADLKILQSSSSESFCILNAPLPSSFPS